MIMALVVILGIKMSISRSKTTGADNTTQPSVSSWRLGVFFRVPRPAARSFVGQGLDSGGLWSQRTGAALDPRHVFTLAPFAFLEKGQGFLPWRKENMGFCAMESREGTTRSCIPAA